jgi:hypothetical protein
LRRRKPGVFPNQYPGSYGRFAAPVGLYQDAEQRVKGLRSGPGSGRIGLWGTSFHKRGLAKRIRIQLDGHSEAPETPYNGIVPGASPETVDAVAVEELVHGRGSIEL